MNKILETTKFVVENSTSVKINQEKIVQFCKILQDEKHSHWLSNSPIQYIHLGDTDKLNFLLVFNSTSFCYWGDPKWTIDYKNKSFDGSWAMVAAIMRAMENGMPILDARFRSDISKEEYAEILQGNIKIPLFEERWRITKEVARLLNQEYAGDFAKLVHSANGDGQKLLETIIKTFPSFEDISEYMGRTIYFYKRAQLLVEDIFQSFAGKGYGALANMDSFTACADYKLPQSLRKLGIPSYTKGLEERIDGLVKLPAHSPEEVEIRANTIWAVEMIKGELKKLGKNVSSITVNDYLWLMGQHKDQNTKPYHRTFTTAY